MHSFTLCWGAGSWHDSTNSGRLYERLRGVPAPFKIVADSAFRGTDDMKGKIDVAAKKRKHVISLSLPSDTYMHLAAVTLARDREEARQQLITHRMVVSVRQAAEWGMRAIQGPFARLKTALPIDNAKRKLILTVIVMLHNLRTRRVGFNQIATVYADAWEPAMFAARTMHLERYFRL